MYIVSVISLECGSYVLKYRSGIEAEDIALEISKEPDVDEVQLSERKGNITNLVAVYEDGVQVM